jgi:membrane protein GlpM
MYGERGVEEIQQTNIFALWSIIPYFAFVLTIFFTVKKFGIGTSLAISTGVWFILAIGILITWKYL